MLLTVDPRLVSVLKIGVIGFLIIIAFFILVIMVSMFCSILKKKTPEQLREELQEQANYIDNYEHRKDN